jgi:hypothetical protein
MKYFEFAINITRTINPIEGNVKTYELFRFLLYFGTLHLDFNNAKFRIVCIPRDFHLAFLTNKRGFNFRQGFFRLPPMP